jgi:tripartite-type tricarboxylate transporter receptor subunit TctC
MLIARSASCLTVHPSVPAKNVKEFITYVKANPGKVNVRLSWYWDDWPSGDGAI